MTNFVRSKWDFLPRSALLLILLAGFSMSIAGQSTRTQPYFTEPAISPDGSEIESA